MVRSRCVSIYTLSLKWSIAGQFYVSVSIPKVDRCCAGRSHGHSSQLSTVPIVSPCAHGRPVFSSGGRPCRLPTGTRPELSRSRPGVVRLHRSICRLRFEHTSVPTIMTVLCESERMSHRVAVIGTGAEPDEPGDDGYAMAYHHAAGYDALEVYTGRLCRHRP